MEQILKHSDALILEWGSVVDIVLFMSHHLNPANCGCSFGSHLGAFTFASPYRFVFMSVCNCNYVFEHYTIFVLRLSLALNGSDLNDEASDHINETSFLCITIYCQCHMKVI